MVNVSNQIDGGNDERDDAAKINDLLAVSNRIESLQPAVNEVRREIMSLAEADKLPAPLAWPDLDFAMNDLVRLSLRSVREGDPSAARKVLAGAVIALLVKMTDLANAPAAGATDGK